MAASVGITGRMPVVAMENAACASTLGHATHAFRHVVKATGSGDGGLMW